MNTALPCSMDAYLKSSELTSRGESSILMIGRALFDSGFAENTVASGSSAESSVVGESPVGSKLPSSDEVVYSHYCRMLLM